MGGDPQGSAVVPKGGRRDSLAAQRRLTGVKYGPAMTALATDLQRAFVVAFVDRGEQNATAACRDAGYEGTKSTISKQAWELKNDPRVQRAIREVAEGQLASMVPMALRTVATIADLDNEIGNPGHKLKAALGLLDRGGMAASTEHHHTHEHKLDDPALLARVRVLADRLGVPMEQLVGRRLAGPVTDAQFEEVK